MEFQIDFNRGDNEDGLIALGATIKQIGDNYGFFIEIKDFAELEAFELEISESEFHFIEVSDDLILYN